MTSPSEITPGRAAYEAHGRASETMFSSEWDDFDFVPERERWETAALAVLSQAFPGLRRELDAAKADRNELAHINTSQACLIGDLQASLSSLTDRAEAGQTITEDEAGEFRKLTARAVPIPGIDDDPADALLALQLPPNASGATTLSGYLAELLMTLWADPRAFDAELPFGAGSQGWEDMLYKVAAAASDGTESPLHLVRSAIAKLGEVTP